MKYDITEMLLNTRFLKCPQAYYKVIRWYSLLTSFKFKFTSFIPVIPIYFKI